MKSEIPKVLHHLWGQPMGAWAIKAALHSGAEQVITVVGHQSERVSEALKKVIPQMSIVLQAEQKGTGHAVQMALPNLEKLEGTVLVICGDTPCLTGMTLEQLCLAREETNAPLSLATAIVPEPTGYGRIVRDMLGRLQRIVEQKDASVEERQIDEINTGVYAFDAAFFA
jgi:bifunctional UDP-N-acetylglucosamine pyrophosphorylase/glucosamine-1-phosphate N-acetyltransferase